MLARARLEPNEGAIFCHCSATGTLTFTQLSMSRGYRPRIVWWALLAATTGVLVLAMLPPVLPAEMAAVVRGCFGPVCHQIPARSPHFGGVPVAICDRCVGIYGGLVIGVLVTGWGDGLWQMVGTQGRYVLLGSLVPLGIDWGAPVLGLWSSFPASRAVTGFVFGSIAASYVTHRLLRRLARTPSGDGFAAR